MSIRDNIKAIQENIADAAIRAGRRVDDICLLAVTKFVEEARIAEAVVAGITAVGENRVQELLNKLDYFKNQDLSVHLIGQLQTNKVKYVIGQVCLIQSVDRLKLAEEISRQAIANSCVQDILIEVNIGNEPQKGGIVPDELEEEIGVISALPGICVKGLMCVPPAVGEGGAQVYFARMRRLFDDLSSAPANNVKMEHLSMGMSGDYKAAIAEGSTMVRIGTAIFGARN